MYVCVCVCIFVSRCAPPACLICPGQLPVALILFRSKARFVYRNLLFLLKTFAVRPGPLITIAASALRCLGLALPAADHRNTLL